MIYHIPTAVEIWYDLFMYKNWESEASFSDLIISHLLSCRSIKIQRRVLFELVQEKRKQKKQVFLNNIHRLKNKGVISFGLEGGILINKKQLRAFSYFKNIKTAPTGKIKILVLFDIPESKRKVRDWVRLQLKLWNFKMIQQSAWTGDGPLPKEFLERLRSLEVDKCLKVFKISS